MVMTNFWRSKTPSGNVLMLWWYSMHGAWKATRGSIQMVQMLLRYLLQWHFPGTSHWENSLEQTLKTLKGLLFLTCEWSEIIPPSMSRRLLMGIGMSVSKDEFNHAGRAACTRIRFFRFWFKSHEQGWGFEGMWPYWELFFLAQLFDPHDSVEWGPDQSASCSINHKQLLHAKGHVLKTISSAESKNQIPSFYQTLHICWKPFNSSFLCDFYNWTDFTDPKESCSWTLKSLLNFWN